MPRCVRNFWIETEVSGYKRDFAFGPRGGEGEFYMTIYIREHGSVSERTVRLAGHLVKAGAGLRILASSSDLPDGGVVLLESDR